MGGTKSKMRPALVAGVSRNGQSLQIHPAAPQAGVNQVWLDQLDEYGVEYVILDLRGDSDLVRMFRRQPGWVVDFEDGEAVILARAASRRTSDEGRTGFMEGRVQEERDVRAND